MKPIKILFVFLILLLFVSPAAPASDFDWIKDFNIQAQADPSGFRASLGARFKIGNAEIEAVLSNVENPADAYIVCRLGEMSRQPTAVVIEKYKLYSSDKKDYKMVLNWRAPLEIRIDQIHPL